MGNTLSKAEKMEEYIKCATDPIYFIEKYIKVYDQTQKKIVPLILFPFQKRIIKEYENHSHNIINKARQMGISTITCAYLTHYSVFNSEGYRYIAIVADKLETAVSELMSDVINFIDELPDWLKEMTKAIPKDNINSKRHIEYLNGTTVKAFATTKLRGPSPTKIVWDECAWAEKKEEFWTSAAPSVATGGGAILISCVTKDSYIYTDNGIKQISQYIDNETLGGSHIKDIYVLGSDNKLRKTNIIFKNGYVDTLKIKTSYGELESSKNHKYWAYKKLDNKYDWYKAEELEIGDYISHQIGMNVWGNNDDCSDFNPTTTSNKIKHPFKPTKITKDIAYLIGLYISEGCGNLVNDEYIGINLICEDNISKMLEKLNLPYYCNDNQHYKISVKNLSEFLEYLGFNLSNKASEKIIPSRVLEMSEENIISMMQGIMDGNGWVSYNSNKRKLKVGIGLSSLELIKQLRIILNNFGILTEYDKYFAPETKKVKVKSLKHRIIANNNFANVYFKKIGFRFNKKNNIIKGYDTNYNKHIGYHDNIPNGTEIVKEIFTNIKYYGIHKELLENNIKIKKIVQHKKKINPYSRKTILNLIDLKKNKLSDDLLNRFKFIINNNIFWTPIKNIEKSKNYTYDFSMSNDNEKEWNEHHMSIVYNGILTHQTPNGMDSVFYKTFDAAKRGDSNFNAIEIYWWEDPRYNKGLKWIKGDSEIETKDPKIYKELIKDGYEAWSPWFEERKKEKNYDLKSIAQEFLCNFLGSGGNFVDERYILSQERQNVQDPKSKEYIDKNLWIWEEAEIGSEYIMGIDVSLGSGDDFSTIVVLKIDNNEITQVAEYQGKIPPDVLGELSYGVGMRYNEAYAVVDVTGGVGASTVERMIEKGYKNIHYDVIRNQSILDRLSEYLKHTNDNKQLAPGFIIGANRGMILQEMERAIRMDELIVRSYRFISELKTFVTVEGNRIADHKRSFHDDIIFAFAIALYVLSYEYKKRTTNDAKQMLDIWLKMGDGKLPSNNINTKENRNKNNPYGDNSWLFKF
ncbi:MAG: LAGLIDADG family homing endonuclease [bacterium]